MSSLYSQYIQEREGKQIIESEYGFATYSFTDDNCVYIEDIFVIPEARKAHMASELADKIAQIAKERGCKKMYGSVSPSAKNSTASIKVLIAYGMSVSSSSNNFILFSKELV